MKVAVFIDCQNDFVRGVLGSDWAKRVAPEIINFARECRSRGYALYATADTHERKSSYIINGEPIRGYLETQEGKNLPIEHCITGTYGHQIIEGLVKDENRDVIIPQAHIFDKTRFGCRALADGIYEDFNGVTHKDAQGDCYKWVSYGEPIDEIFVCGFVTSICVLHNVVLIKEKFPEVKVTVYQNLCADIDDESHKCALKVLKNGQVNIADWEQGK